jgi:ribosomal-protein-alanine acetyltransferase
MSWTLRHAGPDDLAGIMLIENSTFAGDAWETETMAAELASEHTRYLVVTPVADPSAIIGYGGVQAPVGSGDADIQTIAVASTAQSQGIGRALMHRLIDEARSRGARQVFLEVRADNAPARALYASLGFAELGVRPKYYQPDGVDAIVMRLAVPAPTTALVKEARHE